MRAKGSGLSKLWHCCVWLVCGNITAEAISSLHLVLTFQSNLILQLNFHLHLHSSFLHVPSTPHLHSFRCHTSVLAEVLIYWEMVTGWTACWLHQWLDNSIIKGTLTNEFVIYSWLQLLALQPPPQCMDFIWSTAVFYHVLQILWNASVIFILWC